MESCTNNKMFVGPDFFPQIKDVTSLVNQFPDSDST